MALVQPKSCAGGAFAVFMAAKRADFQAECPGKAVGVIMQLAGDTWKKLSEAEKAPYQEKFETAKAKYATDLAAFTEAGGVRTKGGQALRKQRKLLKMKACGEKDEELKALAKKEKLEYKLKSLMDDLTPRLVLDALINAKGSIKGAKHILLGGACENEVVDSAPEQAMKREIASGSDSLDAEPPQKSAKIASASSPADADTMAKVKKEKKIAREISPADVDTMAQAKKEQLHLKLEKLMDFPKIKEKQLDTSVLFKALQDAKGSVVVAKHALLGAPSDKEAPPPMNEAEAAPLGA